MFEYTQRRFSFLPERYIKKRNQNKLKEKQLLTIKKKQGYTRKKCNLSSLCGSDTKLVTQT